MERWFEWKATCRRLEIKIHMVGMEYLGLNTWVGDSLSENECWSVGMFWWLSFIMKEGWRGIYSLHTKSNCYTHFTKLDGTESENSIRPIQFKMWKVGFSVGPIWSSRWDRCARVRVKPHLSLTDYANSVRPILVISKTESWLGNLGGTDCLSRWDRNNCKRQQRVCKPNSVRPRSLSVEPNC